MDNKQIAIFWISLLFENCASSDLWSCTITDDSWLSLVLYCNHHPSDPSDLMIVHVMTFIWYVFRNTPRRTKRCSWFSLLPTLFSLFPYSQLSLVSRLVFTLKVFNFHTWQLLQIDVFWYLVFYSWYWWMYAVNVFIYMITDQGFRDVYQLFLKDLTGCFND